ncbi:MAG: HlyD family efflux transporter periplasmic adaptor subunit, partial [Peptococcaceae bacterium]|nr:HlyD family efflux transporter periplasmic adaptor subunit [Peptococcaceae bacterium]
MSLKKIFEPKKRVILAAAIILLCTALIFGFLHLKAKSLAADRENNVQFTGNIEAEEVMLSFKVPGKIATMPAGEGDSVKKDQVLARLDTQELALKVAEAKAGVAAAEAQVGKAGNSAELQRGLSRSQINSAQAALEQARAGYDLAAANWERINSLYENGVASRQQRDEVDYQHRFALGKLNEAKAALDKAVSSETQVTLSQNDISSANAQLALARAKYDEAVVYLNNSALKTPLTGVITLKSMKAGEMVAAGTPVFKVTDLQNIWLKVYVPETKIGRVNLGQKVRISVQSYP